MANEPGPDAELDVKALRGLSEVEAAARLATHGPNELPSARRPGLLRQALAVVKEPMFLLLVACGTIYLLLGDLREALMLLGFVFVVMGITLYQERKTERALETLRDLSSPRALVIRDGARRRVAGREVVPGDLVVLGEGDRVPADAVVIYCNNLQCDESLLTGESVPVRKRTGALGEAVGRPGGDDLPWVYSGTLVVGGQAVTEIGRTGAATELGKIGRALQSVTEEPTLLEREIATLVRRVAIAGVVLCLLVFAIYALTRGSWLKGFLAGLSLAMAMLPEEFPVVLTIFFALGAWRISKQRVLTRRVAVIETLGAATVLCVDKTGTLTQNQMAVREVVVGGRHHVLQPTPDFRMPPEVDELVEYGILASQRDPFDPMEKAFKRLEGHYSNERPRIYDTWRFVKEYPLSPKLLALSHVWRRSDNGDGDGGCVIACKGAPEAIADICHLDDARREALLAEVGRLAAGGLRVLGVAKATFAAHELPTDQHDFAFTLIGLVGLADPVRPGVPAALAECYAAGIRVVMITGDHPETAKNIARQIRLANSDEALTGHELYHMDELELGRRVATVNIFSRVVPEQKLKLVDLLKRRGEVVAMTGDGVNDAPALKAAHIGIAMGGRGTDVAREAASLVLVDDDFGAIVQAVKLGRRIFDNIGKALSYIVAIHVPIAGLSLLPVILGWPLILSPVHIVFLELIIDPACSTVFEAEPEEGDVMRRPPRGRDERVFGRRPFVLSALQGTGVLLTVLAVILVSGRLRTAEPVGRAMAFATLVISNLALILTNLSRARNLFATLGGGNRALLYTLGGALALLGAVLTVPFLQKLFQFAPLAPRDLLFCVAAGLFSVGWFEVLKAVRRGGRRRREKAD